MEKIIKIEISEIIIKKIIIMIIILFFDEENLRRDEKQVLICFHNKKSSNLKKNINDIFINSIFVGEMSSLMSSTQALVE